MRFTLIPQTLRCNLSNSLTQKSTASYRSSKIGTLNLLLFSILDPLPVLTASGIHFAATEASMSRGESPIA